MPERPRGRMQVGTLTVGIEVIRGDHGEARKAFMHSLGTLATPYIGMNLFRR
jgi:hypothetical protein